MKYVHKKSITKEKIDEKAVLFDSEEFLFYELNETMAFIWEELESPKTIEELSNKLASKFNIDKDEAKKDIKDSVEELVKLKLLKKEME